MSCQRKNRKRSKWVTTCCNRPSVLSYCLKTTNCSTNVIFVYNVCLKNAQTRKTDKRIIIKRCTSIFDTRDHR